MFMMFPQSSMYCFRSLSCRKIGTVSHRARADAPPCVRPPPRRSYQVLEDEHQALVGVDDVVQRDDVGVFEVLQQ